MKLCLKGISHFQISLKIGLGEITRSSSETRLGKFNHSMSLW